jgi:hypothetical protein
LRLDEFRERVREEFGWQLERATPANVRDFVTRLQSEIFDDTEPARRVVLQESASTYEEIVADFFSRVLDLRPEEAVVLLWLLAFELYFGRVEEEQGEVLARLFGSIPPEQEIGEHEE